MSPGNVVVSTIKKCEDDASVVVRCYDIEGKDAAAEIRFFVPVRRALRTNILEEEGRELRIEKGAAQLKVGHYAIETLKLAFGR